jgi:23S rRNA (uridine2552-2'-O)-methyltransferase
MKSASTGVNSSFRAKTVTLKKARGRKTSSQRWLMRHLNDPYVQQAQIQGYRSRAAFKILEIDAKYKLFKPGQIVTDLGAAPGGWSQVVAKVIKADVNPDHLFAIDLLPVEPLPGMAFIQGDFLDRATQQHMLSLTGNKVDVVISDMAAQTTGHASTDHIRTKALAESAFSFAQQVLKEGGSFITKVFAGGTHQELLVQLKKAFATVKHFKPPASRKESPEVYVVCQGFRR